MSPQPAAAPADRDERLAAVLDELSRQVRQGQSPDLDAVIHNHPDLADELRQLWAAAQLADALSRPAGEVSLDQEPCHDTVSPSLPRAFGDYILQRELGRG